MKIGLESVQSLCVCVVLACCLLVAPGAQAKPLITSSETSLARACLQQTQPPARLVDLCQAALDVAALHQQDRLELMVALGEAQLWADDAAAAEATLLSVLDQQPTHRDALDALAWQYWEEDQYDEARSLFQTMVDAHGDENGFGGLASIARLADDNYEEARRLIDIALAIDPGDDWFHRESGWIHFEQEHHKPAVRAFEWAIKLDAEQVNSFYGLGRAYYGLARYEPALNAFSQAIELAPNTGYLHSWRASSLYRMKRFRAAIKEARVAIRDDPTDPFAYVTKAASHRALEEIQEAIDTYRAAVEAGAGDNYLHYWFAHSLFSEGRPREALEQIDLALDFDGTAAVDHELRADIALELEALPTALEAARAAQSLAPEASYPVYQAALALLRSGETDAALAEFDRAVTLGPDEEMTRTFARWLVRLGKPMAALTLRQRNR
ncbi:MAG: tetratricopeptide repeat protein [Pseudomonadota bacterium]